MSLLAAVTRRRFAAHAAIAVTVATATAAGVALAGGGPATGSSTQASAANTITSTAPDPIAAVAQRALDALVARGTIDQAQADTIEQQVMAGSVDPRALVSAGVVDAAQMAAVGNTLDQVKRSAGW
jgi:hypothetical protein